MFFYVFICLEEFHRNIWLSGFNLVHDSCELKWSSIRLHSGHEEKHIKVCSGRPSQWLKQLREANQQRNCKYFFIEIMNIFSLINSAGTSKQDSLLWVLEELTEMSLGQYFNDSFLRNNDLWVVFWGTSKRLSGSCNHKLWRCSLRTSLSSL